ncbi:hypothetical protein EV140_0100 [Microcella alkaliphila]|uniref:Uncharacterized protein n=1 Tax=Microcella alkaliphila TaxID=279828 RepID=A0A4Q7TZ30_9MICO|nr:hypothetical protein [Microcella alkaliphila]RZT66426.1 hypothetical protein EV140_0100 [Microcella alkaliphila]
MSPEPIRREPGPRDWTPSGGYQYGSAAATAPSATTAATGLASRGLRAKRPRRTRSSASRDHGFAALIVGVIAFATAAISWPAGEGGYTVLLSTIGLIAVALGISTLRAWRVGLARRRGMARTGVALGGLALASSAIILANGWFGLTLPALPDVTRAVVASATGASTASIDQDAVVSDGAVIGAPNAAIVEAPVFADAQSEFVRLSMELGTSCTSSTISLRAAHPTRSTPSAAGTHTWHPTGACWLPTTSG